MPSQRTLRKRKRLGLQASDEQLEKRTPVLAAEGKKAIERRVDRGREGTQIFSKKKGESGLGVETTGKSFEQREEEILNQPSEIKDIVQGARDETEVARTNPYDRFTVAEKGGRALKKFDVPLVRGIGSLLETGAQIGIEVDNQPITQSAGDIAGAISSLTGQFFTGSGGSMRKDIQVSEAENSFNDFLKAANSDLDRVRTGELNAIETKTNIRKATDAIGRLRDEQKGLGRLDQRYWKTQGLDIQIAIDIAEQQLDDLQRELIIAEQQGRLIKAGLQRN